MPGYNERVLMHAMDVLEEGVVHHCVKFMRLVHRGTVTRFGNSPGTPVDTGEARGGGTVGLNAPPTFRPPDEAPSYPIMGDNEIDRIFRSVRPGDTLYWKNNVPYIVALEGGWSKQAPDGFLRHSVVEAKRVLEAERWP